MLIYYLLIALVLITPVFTQAVYADLLKRRKLTVTIAVGAMFLLCALKNTSVGIDIPGYEIAYNQAGQYGWFDTSYIYFEKGYVLFEKLFNMLGFSFQAYMFVVYALIFIPVGVFIYRYSSNVTLSCIIYICYQTLIFNISGIRQSIAMSICIVAYLLLEKQKIKFDIAFFALVLIAMQMHRSAIIFLLAYLARKIKLNVFSLGAVLVAFVSAVLFRGSIVSLVNSYTGKYQAAASMSLGGNFMFLLVTMMVLLFLYFKFDLKKENNKCGDYHSINTYPVDISRITIVMLIFTVFLQLVLNGSSALRGANYFSLFMILAIPDISTYFNHKSRLFFNIAVIIFMIVLFYAETLSINQFNCVPYSFFWQ